MVRLAAALSVLLTASIASAEPPGLTQALPLPAPAASSDWVEHDYGRQTLIADGVAAGLLLVAVNSHDGAGLAELALGTYVLGGPVIHVAHGRVGVGLVSAVMRVAFPIAGAYAGQAFHQDPCANSSEPSLCEDTVVFNEEVAIGILVGMVTASAVDAAFFARADDPPKPAPSWGPTLHAAPGGLSLGVAGSF